MKKDEKEFVKALTKKGFYWAKVFVGNAKQGKAHNYREEYWLLFPDGKVFQTPSGRRIIVGKTLQKTLGGRSVEKSRDWRKKH